MIMNIPLLIVLLYVVLLFVISFNVSRKQKKDGDAFLCIRAKTAYSLSRPV